MGIKVFNLWESEGITVEDQGLANYICLDPKIVPKTPARHAGNRFYKSKVFIVERFMNKLMDAGHKGKKHFKTSYHQTGKAHTAYNIVERAFKLIEKRTKKNPIEVFVHAVVNAAPREETITIEYGGARYPKAVECAPQRRIDLVLRYFVQGSYHKSFNSKKPIDDILADEIIAAYNSSSVSAAVAKKQELERQADGSR